MKINVRKLKEGFFTFCVIGLALLVAGGITAIATAMDQDYSSIVMANSENITFTNPLKDCEVLKDYSENKLQFNSTLKQWEAHKAIDLKAELGQDVFAVADGEVKSIETTHLKGTTVVIKHLGGFESVYSSLSSSTSVKVGEKVKAGSVIGKVDNSASGEVDEGVHLHFELLKDGKKVDPNLYFSFAQK